MRTAGTPFCGGGWSGICRAPHPRLRLPGDSFLAGLEVANRRADGSVAHPGVRDRLGPPPVGRSCRCAGGRPITNILVVPVPLPPRRCADDGLPNVLKASGAAESEPVVLGTLILAISFTRSPIMIPPAGVPGWRFLPFLKQRHRPVAAFISLPPQWWQWVLWARWRRTWWVRCCSA